MNKAFKLDKNSIEDIVNLTSLQEGILFHYLKDVSKNLYFVQLSLEIQGAVKFEYFQEAWNKVIENNEMLRTVYRWEKLNKPIQVILKEKKVDIRYYDLSKEEKDLESEYQKIKCKDSEESFDLREVPFRLTLCKFNANRYRLIISNHHILYDGWSNGIILKEFLSYYNNLVVGSSLEINKKISFKNYIKQIGKPSIEDRTFWKDYLKGYEVNRFFRTGRKGLVSNKTNKSFKHVISEEKLQLLKNYCETHRLTIADILYNTWGILLSKYSGIEDILFGTAVSGRNIKLEGIEEIVGLFINTIPLRISLSLDKPLIEIINENATQLRERVNFENVPLHEILNDSEYKDDALFESIFVIENYPLSKNSLQQGNELAIKSFDIKESTNYKLTVSAFLSNKIEINYNYSNSEFDKGEIEKINKHFVTILDSILDHEESKIEEIELLSEEEKQQLLYEFNDTKIDYPSEKTIHELFEEQVETNPDRIVIVRDDICITYNELNKRSNQIARCLKENGIGVGSVVGLMVERSEVLMVSILGILKSGAAYLPINYDWPEERVNFMLSDTCCSLMLYENKPSNIKKYNCKLVDIQGVNLNKWSTGNLNVQTQLSNIIYIIYTSGTTGVPKGVLTNHRNVIRVVSNTNYINIKNSDKILQLSSYTFDGSVFDIYGALLNGSSLVMLNKDQVLSVDKLLDIISKRQITIFFLTTALFNSLVDFGMSKLKDVKKILFGGERISISHTSRAINELGEDKLIHVYGPTETTVYASYHEIKKLDIENEIVPIGKPISNTSLYIFDKNMKLVPKGIQGEIYIGGQGNSIGYLNNAELSSKRFVNNPYKENDILYKSGDIGVMLRDGSIEFLDRNDSQVKIRGFRIELGEIESSILKHPEVKETVVLCEKNQIGEKYLCAYIVAKTNDKNLEQSLREHIKGLLPDFMLPSYFVEIENIPLNINGKVDRKSLPEPELKAGAGYVAPNTLIETNLVKIWSEVLNIKSKEISTNVSFFELGGHSLKATQLVSHIHKALEVRINLNDVFQYQTIQAQAGLINSSESSSYFSIPKAKIKEYYPLSSSQRRLYLLQQMDLGSTAYNMPGLIPVPKGKNKHQIKEAFNKLIARHENLRTSFVVKNQLPVQYIHSEVSFSINEYQLTKAEVNNLKKDLVQTFDLSHAPLLRVSYLEISDGEDMLFIDMHHIISDGRSHAILEEEFNQLLDGKELNSLHLHYKDYSEWQNSKEQQERIKQQETYWLNKYTGELPALDLPVDFSRPLMQSFEGASVSIVLSREETGLIHEISKDQGLTLYMSLLSIFKILLAKLSGQEDIIVGSPIAARRHSDLQDIVGMFINTLAIRSVVSGNMKVKDYLQELKENTLEAYENQEYQFEDLVEQVVTDRDTSRNPVFDVMFNFLEGESQEIIAPTQEELKHIASVSKFDLSLTALNRGSALELNFEYSTSLFKPATIDRFIGYFRQIIKQLPNKLDSKLSIIEILPESEKQQLLYDFNDTRIDYPKDKTIHQIFEEQVERTPENVAIRCQGEEISYKDLNIRSNQLCNYLLSNTARNKLIAIMCNRSIDMIVGILGILKSGHAYLPLDPKHPFDRNKKILEESQTGLIIVDNNDFEYKDIKSINLGDENIYKEKTPVASKLVESSDLAYVIYTSGSTGTPKGVMITHGNIVNFITGMSSIVSEEDKGAVLSMTTISFDIFGLELYVPLFQGKTMILAKDQENTNVKLIDAIIRNEKVSILQLTPSRLSLILSDANSKEVFENIKVVMVGGEELPISLLTSLRNIYEGKIYNMYGPTETTIWSTFKDVSRDLALNIGKPISNTQIYILDKSDKIQPIGVAGELCISGVGLAQGYLRNPGLTAEKFIAHPYKEGERLYRTGDLARWLPDGNIEFLGRIDHQVKIRGFRIELGEIESTLQKHGSIKESVVIAREENGDKYLCAYLVCKEEVNQEELRTYLLENLPDYMVPSYFVEMDSLPLNTNGKVNRKVLPSPEIKAGDNYVAPSTELEKTLLEVWSEVLNIDKEEISINANFFSMGGHSLKATILASNIHKETGVEFSLREIFLHPTIKSQASQLAKSTTKEFVSIPKAVEQSNYPLSPAQKRLYLLQQFDLASTVYNMPFTIPLDPGLEKSKINEVFKKLIERHESFRTSIIEIDQEPVQVISKNVEFELEELKIEPTRLDDVHNEFIKPFDLSRAPLLRAAMVDVKGGGSLLMIDMHHIISDGTSHAILGKEFQALLSGEELAPLPLQYRDYSQWQSDIEQQGLIKNQEQYWLTKFEGDIPVLNLPTDYVRPSVQSHEGAKVSFVLSKEETEEIRIFTEENELTLYMSLLSVFSILLSKLSGQEDIVVGTPIAGRNHAGLENIVGMFVNTLSMRNEVKGGETIQDFVSNLKQTVLGAYENQNYQFEDLVDKVSAERDISRNPIFDVMLNLFNQPEYSSDLNKLINQESVHDNRISKFDLTLTAVDYGEQLMLSFEYCTRLFKTETIDRFIVYFKLIVSQLVKNSEVKISAIDILTEEEKHRLLYEFNNTKTDYPKNKTVHQLFEEQVEKFPNKLALEFKNKTYTYKELNEESNKVANCLIERKVFNEQLIGLMVNRSSEMIIGILGILKSGGAYVPIDPEYPKERINHLIKDSGVIILLSTESLENLCDFQGELILLDGATVDKSSTSYNIINNTSNNLAYVMYTSGSTGQPKGVEVEHKNVVRLVKNASYYPFYEGHKILQTGAPVFDATTFEIWGALLNGGSLHIPDNETIIDAELFGKCVKENSITTVWLTSSLFNLLADQDINVFSSLSYLLVGGDVLSVKYINKVKEANDKLVIINGYGPTENTTFSTTFKIEREYKESIPIGKPISNSTAYILDKYNNIQPIGVPGELVVGGDGIARRYLNNPELTREKFITNPFKEGERLYKTGDLVRWLPDGNIEFLGRIDHQVKIRGFRIELGEIETTLLQHEKIKDSVVLARENNEDKYLCAYIVAEENFNEEEIRTYLSSRLPDYMIPSYFVELELLPLTSNGKVNRKVLPSPEIKAGDDYAAPANELEEKLVEIWAEVLNIEKGEISTTANFFSLGGHSLKATILTGKIYKECGVKLTLRDVFIKPTLKEQAKEISNSNKNNYIEILPVQERDYYEASSLQKRIFIQQKLNSKTVSYNMPSVIILKGELDFESVKRAFQKIVKRHEVFRTSFKVINKEIVQIINTEVEVPGSFINSTENEWEQEIKSFVVPFDIEKAPLIRYKIVKIAENKHALLVDMHHIIADGVSRQILIKEFTKLYNDEKLDDLTIQYKDFAAWHNKFINSEEYNKERTYWHKKYESKLSVLEVPSDFSRPKIKDLDSGDSIDFELGEDVVKKIDLFVNQLEGTTYMFLLLIFKILLAKLSGTEDVVLGTLVAGRNHDSLNNSVGMFVNTLALRTTILGELSFRENFEKIKQNVIESFGNQSYQIDDLINELGLQGDSDKNPLLNYLFNMNNMDMEEFDIPGLKVQNYTKSEENFSKFDLQLVASRSNDIIKLNLRYYTKLFKKSTVEGYIELYTDIIDQVIENNNILVNDISTTNNLTKVTSTIETEDEFNFELD